MKKILRMDSSYRVVNGEGIELMDSMPPGIYSMKFGKMTGFWFELMQMEAFPGKVYGDQTRIKAKVMRKYAAVSGRNLGILLSGKKGTGKSLFARNLAVEMAKYVPVIVVRENIPGMLTELANIQGRAVIVFDEFEKMFRDSEGDGQGDDIRQQETALSFFDGVESKQEKLLVLTVNDTFNLSKYLLGRPGRIHYHFRLQEPTLEEVSEYVKDNLKVTTDADGFRKLVSELSAMGLSWDSLSAVVSELNAGEDMDETVKDLNIRTDSYRTRYHITATYDDSEKDTVTIDRSVTDDPEMEVQFSRSLNQSKYGGVGRVWTRAKFMIDDVVPDDLGEYCVSKFTQDASEDCDDKIVENAPKIVGLTISRLPSTCDIMARAYSRRGAMAFM